MSLSALGLCVVLGLPAGAAPQPSEAALPRDNARSAAPAASRPSAPPTAALSASSTTFAWTSTATLTVEAVTAQFERFDRELQSLTARFTQRLTMTETGMGTDVDGTVAYRKPERLRIERSRPERQTIVFDGKELWVDLPLRNQVIQLSLEDLKRSDPLAGNLLQFGSYAKMLKAYDVSLDSGGVRPELVLKPKDRSAGFTLRFQLDPDTLFPARTTLTVEAMRIDSTFTGYKFNPTVDDALFKFAPPAGAEVIRNLRPPRLSP